MCACNHGNSVRGNDPQQPARLRLATEHGNTNVHVRRSAPLFAVAMLTVATQQVNASDSKRLDASRVRTEGGNDDAVPVKRNS